SGFQYLDVSCIASTSCVAVGQDLATNNPVDASWNGSSWSLLSPALPPSSAGTLYAVSCSSASSCLAVGYSNSSITRATSPLAEYWNGSYWALTTVPGTSNGALYSISCPTTGSCIVVGAQSYSSTLVLSSAYGWYGTSWT